MTEIIIAVALWCKSPTPRMELQCKEVVLQCIESLGAFDVTSMSKANEACWDKGSNILRRWK